MNTLQTCTHLPVCEIMIKHLLGMESAEVRNQSVPSRGFVFGRGTDGYFAIKPETQDGHIMVVGGVGTGKSTCIVMPTLRVWQARVFAIDIKGELSNYAKKYRFNIKVFSPQDRNAYGYDPYAFLKGCNNIAQEMRAIVQCLIPLTPEIKDPFWIESAQDFLTGAMLYYYDLGHSFVDTLMQIQLSGAENLIEAIFNSDNNKARLYISSFVNMAEKTLSSVFATVSRAITPLVTDDDVVSALSRSNTIEPVDLEYGYDVFLNVPEHLLRQWKNLLGLMVNQFLMFFERRNESHDMPPILFLLDEFPRLGKIPFIMDGLATLRSKKVSICLILQSLAQLDVIYGKDERRIISDTCAYKAILSATDPDTQDYFSKLVGTYEKRKQTTTSAFINPMGNSKSITTEEKPIIKPADFATLRDVVLLHPFEKGFTRVEKVPWWGMG